MYSTGGRYGLLVIVAPVFKPPNVFHRGHSFAPCLDLFLELAGSCESVCLLSAPCFFSGVERLSDRSHLHCIEPAEQGFPFFGCPPISLKTPLSTEKVQRQLSVATSSTGQRLFDMARQCQPGLRALQAVQEGHGHPPAVACGDGEHMLRCKRNHGSSEERL